MLVMIQLSALSIGMVQAAALPSPCTLRRPPLCTTPFVGIRAVLSIPSLGARLGGALLLELAVEVVALLGPGDVVAVPGNS
jgi:hypothetical protein